MLNKTRNKKSKAPYMHSHYGAFLEVPSRIELLCSVLQTDA